MKHKIPFFLVGIIIPILSIGQVDSLIPTEQVIDALENILDQNEEIILSEDVLEELSEITNDTKPNLNALSYEVAVRKLHFSDYQYYQLQLYIENYGQLASIYELEAIDGFSVADRERIAKMVCVAPVPTKQEFFKDFFNRSQSNLFIRYGQIIEHQAGYDTTRNNHYAGSPAHTCFRFNFETQDKLFIKISGEKDAGEQFFKGEQRYGFDFYAGSISIKKMGLVQAAVIGDYRLNFGQGLILGSSLLSGKGGDPGSIRRFSTGIRAIAPTNEGDFLRGAALTIGNAQCQGSYFVGRHFGSTQNATGLDFSYRNAVFKIGLRAIGFSVSDTALSSVSERWRSSFLPTEFNFSVDYQAIIKQFLLFGEMAVTASGKIGCIQTLLFNPTPTSKLAIVLRHYDRDFRSPLGSPFGNNSQNCGESGIYLSSSHILNRKLQLLFYFDYDHLHGLSYRTDAPIPIMEFGGQLQYGINRNSQLTLQYRWRSKPENQSNCSYYKILQEHHRHKCRLQWINHPYPFLTLKTEINWQLNHYPMQKAHYQGLLLYQDAAIQISKPDIVLHLRIAYFDTDRYDERLYAYEDDLYYAFTIGSYYYKGIRGYIVFRYKHKWFSAWLRLAQTYYIDRTTISSGLTEIQRPHKTEIKLQTMFSF